ncbi:MAG TPA: hypothetical protein VN451_00685, partial [Chitinophagaceae bacterium]|nr:hypothetical protein [Chitinophagaceae bacterium]
IYMKKVIGFNLIFFFMFSSFLFQDRNNCELKLNILGNQFPGKVLVQITLTSNLDKTIKVPSVEKLRTGYKGDSFVDCYFEVVEVIGSNKTIELLPTADYQYPPLKGINRLSVLEKKRSIHYQFDLCSFYSFNKNKKYKTRLVFHMGKFLECGKDLYSNWVIIN